MHNLNKFKIIAIAFILLFVFAVAAIYTNTKDVAENKIITQQEKIENQTEQIQNNNRAFENKNEADLSDLRMQIENLSKRIDNMDSKQSDVKCKLQGIMNEGQIEPLSPETTLQEAKYNGDEIVLTCKF